MRDRLQRMLVESGEKAETIGWTAVVTVREADQTAKNVLRADSHLQEQRIQDAARVMLAELTLGVITPRWRPFRRLSTVGSFIVVGIQQRETQGWTFVLFRRHFAENVTYLGLGKLERVYGLIAEQLNLMPRAR